MNSIGLWVKITFILGAISPVGAFSQSFRVETSDSASLLEWRAEEWKTQLGGVESTFSKVWEKAQTAIGPERIADKDWVVLETTESKGVGHLDYTRALFSKEESKRFRMENGKFWILSAGGERQELKKIVLSSFQSHVGIFLKDRSNPKALRGERAFVQNCVPCHHGERGGLDSARAIPWLKSKSPNDLALHAGRESAAVNAMMAESLRSFLEESQPKSPKRATAGHLISW